MVETNLKYYTDPAREAYVDNIWKLREMDQAYKDAYRKSWWQIKTKKRMLLT